MNIKYQYNHRKKKYKEKKIKNYWNLIKLYYKQIVNLIKIIFSWKNKIVD